MINLILLNTHIITSFTNFDVSGDIVLILGGLVTIGLTISATLDKLFTLFKSHKMMLNLERSLILINGRRGELNHSVREALQDTDWSYEDLSLFGQYVATSESVPRKYSESLLRVVVAINLSLSELLDDENVKISSEGIVLLSSSLSTFTSIYRTMPEHHFRSVLDILVTLL